MENNFDIIRKQLDEINDFARNLRDIALVNSEDATIIQGLSDRIENNVKSVKTHLEIIEKI